MIEIPTWVHILPYVVGGRSRDGVDCWGLVVILYKEIYDQDVPEYPHVLMPNLDDSRRASREMLLELNRQTLFHQVDKPQAGDVILLNVLGDPLHIGVILGDNTMIHTGRSHGVVIENYMETKWKSKIAGIYRIK